jgi:hypothetical protein
MNLVRCLLRRILRFPDPSLKTAKPQETMIGTPPSARGLKPIPDDFDAIIAHE